MRKHPPASFAPVHGGDGEKHVHLTSSQVTSSLASQSEQFKLAMQADVGFLVHMFSHTSTNAQAPVVKGQAFLVTFPAAYILCNGTFQNCMYPAYMPPQALHTHHNTPGIR